MLDRFADFLDQHARVLLTTHENPDGDGVGASIALAAHLKAGGKEARIVVTPALPENLRFLDPEGWIEAYDPDGAHRDLSAWPMLGCSLMLLNPTAWVSCSPPSRRRRRPAPASIIT